MLLASAMLKLFGTVISFNTCFFFFFLNKAFDGNPISLKWNISDRIYACVYCDPCVPQGY